MGRMYLGIDPGKSGGFAVLIPNVMLNTFLMPDTEQGVWDVFDRIQGERRSTELTAMIEKVQGFIGFKQPGSAMFKFGHGYGGLRMALIGHAIPFTEATPNVWQRRLGIPSRDNKKETKAQYKKRLCVFARQLFPKYVNRITIDTCDAVLLAEYARRLETGDLEEEIKPTIITKGKK